MNPPTYTIIVEGGDSDTRYAVRLTNAHDARLDFRQDQVDTTVFGACVTAALLGKKEAHFEARGDFVGFPYDFGVLDTLDELRKENDGLRVQIANERSGVQSLYDKINKLKIKNRRLRKAIDSLSEADCDEG